MSRIKVEKLKAYLKKAHSAFDSISADILSMLFSILLILFALKVLSELSDPARIAFVVAIPLCFFCLIVLLLWKGIIKFSHILYSIIFFAFLGHSQ